MNQVPKLKCKIGKTIYNLFIFLGVIVVVDNLNMLPFFDELSTINSTNFLDVLYNSLSTVFGAIIILYSFVTLYTNWYKFVTYKEEPKPVGRTLLSGATPKRCGFLNIFC